MRLKLGAWLLSVMVLSLLMDVFVSPLREELRAARAIGFAMIALWILWEAHASRYSSSEAEKAEKEPPQDIGQAALKDSAGQPGASINGQLRASEDKTQLISASDFKEMDVVGFLSVLQNEAHFIDFCRGSIKDFQDAEVAAAARVVHEGCSKVLSRYFSLSPIETVSEGSPFQLTDGFDLKAYRLLGRVHDNPPYRGTVLHPGWKVEKINLPQMAPDAHKLQSGCFVVSPCEVEVS